MRPLELALALATLPLLLWLVVTRTTPPLWRMSGAVIGALMIIHFAREGQRWQMWPAYLTSLGLVIVSTWPRLAGGSVWPGVLGMGGVVAAAAIATIMPVFQFPIPTGPFPVGTVTLYFIDSRRDEAEALATAANRELMVQAWYPADRQGQHQPFRSPSEVSFRRSRLALVETHASIGVPFSRASTRFPVLIFSPAWTGRRDQNTFQAEELASHGFVVIGVDHPYGSEWTILPDDRRIETRLGEWLDCSSAKAYDSSLRTLGEQLRIRTADIRFVLDEMERLDRKDPSGLFADRLDLNRVGVFGHSFGGAVAAEACRLDSRFRAGVNLDGLLIGEAAAAGIEQPFMFMSQDMTYPTANDLARAEGAEKRRLVFIDQVMQRVWSTLDKYGGYYVSVHGANHMNFSDAPLSTPLKKLTDAGPIDPVRAMRVINDYCLAFFNQYLNGHSEPLLSGPSPAYPEVQIQIWPPPADAAHSAAD